jgi:hypothetical protein
MAWFNADDKMHSHPKSRVAGLEAMGLWLLAGTYCTDYLTDGAVPLWFVESWPRGKQLAQKLIKSGFWKADGEDFQFLSWAEYQRTKKQVLEAKEKAAERKEKFIQNKNSTAKERM